MVSIGHWGRHYDDYRDDHRSSHQWWIRCAVTAPIIATLHHYYSSETPNRSQSKVKIKYYLKFHLNQLKPNSVLKLRKQTLFWKLNAFLNTRLGVREERRRPILRSSEKETKFLIQKLNIRRFCRNRWSAAPMTPLTCVAIKIMWRYSRQAIDLTLDFHSKVTLSRKNFVKIKRNIYFWQIMKNKIKYNDK